MESLLAAYRNLLAGVDAWFDRCEASVGTENIRCRRGCSGCCRGLFDITLLDARLLQAGFVRLPETVRQAVLDRARPRLAELQRRWPGFSTPYLLNAMPDEEWTEMPEDDETPCPLLDENGLCLVYDHRPMTCRLHGIPNIDRSGESFSDEYCTLNFPDTDPLEMPALRWDFRRIFEAELRLFREFSTRLLGFPVNELDTFIPTALFIDFEATRWEKS